MLSTTKASILALCMSHVACAAYLQRRGPAPPATINIPLQFGSDGRYVVPVGMSTGNVQHFNFTLATSTGLTSVAGSGCGSCIQTALYNQSASSSASSLGSSDNVSLADNAYSGSVIKEDCTMQTANGSAWSYPDQTIVVANSQTGGAFSNGTSGLLGLGTNRNSGSDSGSSSNYNASFNDSIFAHWLGNNPAQPAFRYGMEISPPVLTPKNISQDTPTLTPKPDAGTLHWLQPAASSYDNSQVATTAVQSVSGVNYASSSSQPDWTVTLDGWKLQTGSSQAANAEPMVTTVDPYYTDIYFPFAQAQILNQAISGSSFEPTMSSLGNQTATWVIPCDSKFSFTLAINGQSFTLDQSVLSIPVSGGTCVSGIEGWQDQTVSQYILGALFLSQVYVIFNVGRNGTDTVSFAPRVSPSHSNHTGAIVGGVIGGVAGLLLIALAILFIFRRRSSHVRELRTDMLEEENKVAHIVEPYNVGSGSGVGDHPIFNSPPTSPTVASPLLHEEIMPPAYSATEGSSTGGDEPQVRPEKSGYLRSMSVQSGEESNVGSSSQPPPTIPEA